MSIEALLALREFEEATTGLVSLSTDARLIEAGVLLPNPPYQEFADDTEEEA